MVQGVRLVVVLALVKDMTEQRATTWSKVLGVYVSLVSRIIEGHDRSAASTWSKVLGELYTKYPALGRDITEQRVTTL